MFLVLANGITADKQEILNRKKKKLFALNVFHDVVVNQPLFRFFIPIGVVQTARTRMWHAQMNGSWSNRITFPKFINTLFGVSAN